MTKLRLHIPRTDVTKKGSIIGHRIDHNVVEVLRGQQYICRHLEQSHSYVSFVYKSMCRAREITQLL